MWQQTGSGMRDAHSNQPVFPPLTR